jgi:hypothetical protein
MPSPQERHPFDQIVQSTDQATHDVILLLTALYAGR